MSKYTQTQKEAEASASDVLSKTDQNKNPKFLYSEILE